MVRKVFNVIATVFLIFLILIVIVIFIARTNGKSPSLFGYHVFRVSSDSMEPTLKVKEIILVKEVKPEEVSTGDIVTYVGERGEFKDLTITHRVYSGPTKHGDTYWLTTKGDKEGAEPDPEIPFDRVEGKYIRSLPVIDKMYTFFLSPGGLIAFIGLIVVLFGYEIVSLIISYKTIDEADDEYYEPKQKKASKKRKKPKKTHLKK